MIELVSQVTIGACLGGTFSGHADARTSKSISTKQLIESSFLICRARVTSADPFAYDTATNEALTHLVFDVRDVMEGAYAGKPLDFFVRGGVRPDGLLEDWGPICKFTEGETYLLFLVAGAYTIAPFAHSVLGALREAKVGSRTLLVTSEGVGIHEVDEFGVRLGGKVADSEDVRLLRKIRDEGSRDASLDIDMVRNASLCTPVPGLLSKVNDTIKIVRNERTITLAQVPVLASRPSPIRMASPDSR